MRKTYKYTAIFDRQEEGGYTVTVPALPGLVTEGDTIKEARAMAKDAVQCYIESLAKDSMPIPPDSPVINQRAGITVGKIVITPYKTQAFAPVGISDPELFLRLLHLNECLEVLNDDRSSKKERIKNLKDLRTFCDNDFRQLLDREIDQASKPGRKRIKQPKSLTALQREAKKKGLDTMTEREIDAEVRRIRKELARPHPRRSAP